MHLFIIIISPPMGQADRICIQLGSDMNGQVLVLELVCELLCLATPTEAQIQVH